MEITIKYISSYLPENIEKEKGIELTAHDSMSEGCTFILGEMASKLVDKARVLDFWDRLWQLDFKKIVLEGRDISCADGDTLVVELRNEDCGVCLELDFPDKKKYVAQDRTESVKLMALVEEMEEFVGWNQVI